MTLWLDNALRVYKFKGFARFARKARISDADLWRAAKRANEGQIDADLGGGVVKQRIGRKGEGKSGGSRSIILLKKGDRAVFVVGFEKKDRANIDRQELEAVRQLAGVVLGYSDDELEVQVKSGILFRVEEPGEDDGREISH